MPYFINCPRCNRDNKYLKLDGDCPRCSGTGRDWWEDYWLESLHSWALITLDKLKEYHFVEIAHGVDSYVFTYRDEIPEYSIKKQIAEISEELGDIGEIVTETAPSQIFCTHTWWRDDSDSSIESCLKCGKTRKVKFDEDTPNEGLIYNKDLHDNRYYFPNRCYACEHYSDSRSQPRSAEDLIFCNFGGVVPPDAGCLQFKPDFDAKCNGCWNFIFTFEGGKEYISCDVLGELSSRKYSGCWSHVGKESTGVEIPPVDNAIELSKTYSYTDYKNDPRIRHAIFDAMMQSGIQMPTSEELSYDKRCATCTHVNPCAHINHYNLDFGRCDHKGIALINYTGSNRFGYDEKICEDYSRSPSLPAVDFPKVHVDVMGKGLVRLCDGYQLRLGNMFCEILQENTDSVLTRYSYTRRAPVFIQYNEGEVCFDLHFYEEPYIETLDINSTKKEVQDDRNMDWSGVDTVELINAVNKVKAKQLEQGVYNGYKSERCEKCNFITIDSSCPDGSPTGLICQKKDIFVTSNGCCDLFES